MRFVAILGQLCEIATSHNIRSPVFSKVYHTIQSPTRVLVLGPSNYEFSMANKEMLKLKDQPSFSGIVMVKKNGNTYDASTLTF